MSKRGFSWGFDFGDIWQAFVNLMGVATKERKEQDTLKQLKNTPIMSSGLRPRCARSRPRTWQKEINISPKVSLMLSKYVSKSTQRHPNDTQSFHLGLKVPQRVPKVVQNYPKGSPRTPKRLQRHPKGWQRDSKSAPKRAQSDPERQQGTPRETQIAPRGSHIAKTHKKH